MDDLRRLDHFLVRQLVETARDESDRDEFRKLCADAIADASTQLARLARSDHPRTTDTTLALELHTMKGTLASIGLGGLADGLAHIESRLKSGGTVSPDDFSRLHAALAEAGATLLQLLPP
jgi:HPt (histidine-containing phosphotransfer) domain-containing protein